MHFQRRPAMGQVSIERVFAQVRRALPPGIECVVRVSPCHSRGVFRRLANLRAAARHSGSLNHVTGDVHYLALALPGRRTLLTIHDCVSVRRLGGIKRALFRWLWYVLPVRRAALVSVVSESTRRELIGHLHVDPDRVRVVHNCVGPEFKPAPRPFNTKEPVLLQVGTGPNKNLARVIAAVAGLTCRLNLIGRLAEPHRTLLAEHRVRYSNVVFATDDDLVRAYRDCDAVIFASTYEGFGLPILEANATGRPVITGNGFSMPEVAGPAACLVDPFDVASIRSGLVRVLTEPEFRGRLVAAGLENVKRFSPERIAAQYAALYEEVREKGEALKG